MSFIDFFQTIFVKTFLTPHSNEHEQHKTIQANIETTKKFILKELETSEKLTEFKDRLLRDMKNIDKQGEWFLPRVMTKFYLFSPSCSSISRS